MHAAVVNNDFIILNTWIFSGNLTARLQEQTISKFHDVCFMHCRDFLPVVKVSILEGIFGNPLGAKLRDHLNPISKSNKKATKQT